MTTKAAAEKADPETPITIKKYANRRLYNTATSSYVTLDHLAQMVKEGADFVVYDAKSGEDITRSVLTQIIVEEESKGQNMLPISFLRQLIALYGDNMQWMVPRYLEQSMQAFVANQDRMRSYFSEAMGGMFPFNPAIGEVGKQNMAMLERAMRMWAPFAADAEPNGTGRGDAPDDALSPETAAAAQANLDRMQAQLDVLQQQIDRIKKSSPSS